MPVVPYNDPFLNYKIFYSYFSGKNYSHYNIIKVFISCIEYTTKLTASKLIKLLLYSCKQCGHGNHSHDKQAFVVVHFETSVFFSMCC